MVAGVVRAAGDRALELDGSAGRDDRGGEQCRDVADAGKRTGSAGDRAACPSRPTGGDAGAGSGRGSTATATDSEQIRDNAQRADRHERRELAARAAHLAPELAAAGAVVHVPSRQPARTYAPVMRDHELLADRAARGISRLEGLRERHPRPYEQRLDRRHGHAERAGHIRVRHPTELAHQQRRTLLVRQSSDVLDQAAQRLSLLRLDRWVVDRGA
jgi:hypothetical protein